MVRAKKKARKSCLIMLSVQANNACYNVKGKVKAGVMPYLLLIDQFLFINIIDKLVHCVIER